VHNSQKYKKVALLVCAAIALIRLATLAFPDLVDTTEGRYAGVAQLMLERDDWVTPWIHYHGVDKPYLGKPPLHFWLMQISYIIFGQNNFAARFPSFLSAVGIVWLVWHASRVLLGLEAAIVAASVLGSSCMLFFLGGAVVLDVTLTLGISLALVAYLLRHHSKVWGYLMFVGIGLGVLVKGPLALVLVGGIIAPWIAVQRFATGKWPAGCLQLPWIRGITLFLAIVVPWYLWAEQRNPGFLKYFLWNENFGRYLKSDYGDEYGTGHRQPFGASFGMMILGTFPWSLILLALLSLQPKRLFSKESALSMLRDPQLLFALGWAFSSAVLLLGAKQYTATYLMPSIPGFAFLAAACWSRNSSLSWLRDIRIAAILRGSGVLLSLIGLIGAVVLHWYGASLLSSVTVGALSILALCFFGRFFQTAAGAESPFHTITHIALLTAFIYGSTAWCAHNYLSDNRSTHRALRLIRTLVPPEVPVRVGFPYYFPFSASFYSRAARDSRMTLVPLKEGEVKGADVDLFVIRRRNTQKFREETGLATIDAELGQWRIVKALQSKSH
jgi:4-amino-4-deoxy-L-arabinose transferase-like glycosyltransferase